MIRGMVVYAKIVEESPQVLTQLYEQSSPKATGNECPIMPKTYSNLESAKLINTERRHHGF